MKSRIQNRGFGIVPINPGFWNFAMFCVLALGGFGCAEYFPATQAQRDDLEQERYHNAKSGIFAIPWDPTAYCGPAPRPPGYAEPTVK